MKPKIMEIFGVDLCYIWTICTKWSSTGGSWVTSEDLACTMWLKPITNEFSAYFMSNFNN